MFYFYPSDIYALTFEILRLFLSSLVYLPVKIYQTRI